MKVFFRDQVIILSIPTAISFAFSYIHVHSALGIPIIIVVSYLAFLKLGLITRIDIRDSANVLPKKVGDPIFRFLNKIAEKIKSSY